jgi:hypothetical protein
MEEGGEKEEQRLKDSSSAVAMVKSERSIARIYMGRKVSVSMICPRKMGAASSHKKATFKEAGGIKACQIM